MTTRVDLTADAEGYVVRWNGKEEHCDSIEEKLKELRRQSEIELSFNGRIQRLEGNMTFVYHLNMDMGVEDLLSSHSLVHIEVDPDNKTHVWPCEPGMHNRLYHPEWRDEVPAPVAAHKRGEPRQ